MSTERPDGYRALGGDVPLGALQCDNHTIEGVPEMADFHHVGLTVRDVERSYAFYAQVVGMRVWDQNRVLGTAPSIGSKAEARADGVEFITTGSEAFDQLTNADGAKLKYVMLESPDGKLIFQLIEYLAGGDEGLVVGHARPGSMHFSFFVDDVEQAYQLASAHEGAHVASPIVQITPNMRSFYVEDPDGVPVELLEVVK